jgi:hypothetical protein
MMNRSRGPAAVRALLLVAAAAALLSGCDKGPPKALHRERFPSRDAECRAPERPHAFMYPAANRAEYGPDNPRVDGCEILVPDHLFCCPTAARATDR